MIARNVPMVLLALSLSACVVSVNDLAKEQRYVDLERSEPLLQENSFEVQLEMKVGELRVGPASGDDLFQMDLHYNEATSHPRIDFQRDEDKAILRFDMSGEGNFMSVFGESRLHLLLHKDILTQLKVRSGVGNTQLDLGGMSIGELELESGVGETSVSMLEPNSSECEQLELISGVGEIKVVGLGNFRFQHLEFKGGVGSAKLDFTGEWAESGKVEIEVGVGGIELILPRDLGAEIRVSKSFLSAYEMPGFTQKGDTYYSDNLDRAKKVIQIRIRAGIGGVEVKWI